MSRSYYDVLKRPLITEKGTLLREQANVVVFEVDRVATKAEVRMAVEKIFSVTVEGVRTAIVRGKNARMGKFAGRKRNWKKAYVTLKEGDRIEFFEGV
ncbi:MAG: 50S ribosomal protein L23 [Deltaproteobacteria bacterium]|nr:50S ribosomal protein L23 [Deltaproteobacteria bacterium]